MDEIIEIWARFKVDIFYSIITSHNETITNPFTDYKNIYCSDHKVTFSFQALNNFLSRSTNFPAFRYLDKFITETNTQFSNATPITLIPTWRYRFHVPNFIVSFFIQVKPFNGLLCRYNRKICTEWIASVSRKFSFCDEMTHDAAFDYGNSLINEILSNPLEYLLRMVLLNPIPIRV